MTGSSRYIILLFCFITLLVSPASAQRRTSNIIGTVDFRAVVLLHPSMMDYSPAKRAFRVDTANAPAAQLEARRKEHQSRIDELRARSRRMQARITEQHRSHEREMTRLSAAYLNKMKDQVATATAAVETQRYNRNKTVRETNHRGQLRNLGDQLAAISQQLQDLEQIAFHEGHTSPEETRQRFRAIVAEVRQYVQHIATQQKMEIVLNSSYKRSLIHKDSRTINAHVPSTQEYRNVFKLQFPREEEESGHDFAPGFYQTVTDMTQNWLGYGDSILAPFGDELLDSDIIIGGTDITAEVLMAIFRQYRLNENIGIAVTRAATTY